MAYAGFRFAEKVLKAVKLCEKGIDLSPLDIYLPEKLMRAAKGEIASSSHLSSDFFSGVPVELGGQVHHRLFTSFSVHICSDTRLARGCRQARHQHCLVSANDYEKKLLQACYTGLQGNISKGVEFIKSPPS